MDSPENEEKLVLEAATVFLLMKKGFPISRNVRAQWILEHLETVVSIQSPDVEVEEAPELEIVSVLPRTHPASWDIDSSHRYQYRVTKSTGVIFLAHKYRMVLCLDLSPSLGTVDIQHGEIVIDEVYLATKRFLENITKPFTVPGSRNRVMRPDIHVTVIVHTPFFTNPAQQVLVQGWLINKDNVAYLMQFIEKQLNLLEKKISLVTSMANQQLEILRAESDQLVGGLFEEGGSTMGINGAGSMMNVAMVSPEASFVNMLRYGMLALSLLPEHSCANLIVISDGIVGVADIHVLDSIVQQLRATTVACSFIHLGSAYHPHCANGLVPYQDLLLFIATATLGTYMPFIPQEAPAFGGEMNMYHRSFLCWQLYRTETCEPSAGRNIWRTGNSLFYGHQRPQLLRKKQIDDKVTCTLSSLLCCRLRDGYLIKRVAIKDGFLEICFILPWKSHVYLEYLVSTSWPSKSIAASNTIQYTITIEAPYEFLHDITCLSKKPLKSQYRQSVVSRFWATLTALTENDNMLAHFSWFPEVGWTWYNVSETIRSGMPVFYLPSYPSAVNSIQLSEAACPQFGKIWQPVVSLDPQQWARWMHSQKITLILSHDRPLPRYLHQANQSGRFQCVQCRQAAAVLYAMLKNWSTFVLVENHTYVQFIYREAEKPPVSFSVIRINCKALCVVLNVAFSGGTEGVVRHNVVVDLLDRLSKLTLPNRPTEQNETPCCAIIHKALEKILIRYERMPTDLTTVVFPDGTQPVPVRGTQIPGGFLTTTLSRYLFHSRWLWNVKKPFVQTIPGIVLPRLNTTAIARILSTITKMRLAEGFSFSYSSAGIINMVLEVQMQGSTDDRYHPCTIQYVLFPPHVITNPTLERDSDSDEETDEGTADGEAGNEDNEGAGDFQIVTEVWIEPQCGQAKLPTQPTAAYMQTLAYHQLPDAISLVDEECINALLTLEHLSLLSQVEPSEGDADISNGFQYQGSQYGQSNGWLSSGRSTRLTAVSEGILDGLPSFDQRIHPMFFNFDTLRILPKCHQAELLYSMFADGPNYAEEERDDANSILMEILLEHMKRLHNKELLLSDRESQRFTEMLLDRPRDDGPSLPFSPLIDENIRSNIRWRCFVKGISVTHVIVTMMPASDKDVKSMMSSCESEEEILTPEKSNERINASTPIREIVEDRVQGSFSAPGTPRKIKILHEMRLNEFESNASSRTTTAESTPKIERRRSNVVSGSIKPRLILPVYVYDCSLSSLIEVLVDKARSSRVKDTYEDHTFTLGEQVREEYINLKSGGDVKPTSPEPKSEDSDNLSNDQRSLVEHCKLLSLAHCHCYVVAVYKSLALQLPLSYEDMEAAVEQCEEAFIEINITDYLRTVCRHLSNSSEGEWSSNLTSSMCVDAQPLHNLIKEKFRRIITVAFEPVPAHPEFYYCSPSHNSERMDQMEYQRSDSEDDLEGFTFHSETMDCKNDNPSGKANQVTNATWPVTNVAHDEPKRACYDSTESLISDLREDVSRTKEQPLFLQLSCSVHVRSTLSSIPVKLVPTCLTEIRQCLDDYLACSSDDLKITLDIICLNLPKEVLEICLERGSILRTTSYRSASPVGSNRTESESSPGNDTQISEGEPGRERIAHLPLHQHHAISNLTAEIEWLLKDETATALLDKSPPTEETLKFVAQHVSDSNDRPSCHKDKVPLHFVFPSNNSSPKFYEELKNLQIDRYSIQQTPSFFYLVKNQDITDVDLDEECFKNDDDEQIAKEDKSGLFLDMDDPASNSHDANSRTSKQDSGDLPGCNSEISSIGDGHPGTDDGYEGDSSNSEDDCNWLVDLDDRRTLLPNFWLILQVENDHVDVYFHCRFLEFVSSEVDRYRQVQKMVVAQITAICRRVNQYLLLENLNDTRNCDSLLEAESHEDHTWRGESSNESGGLALNHENAANMTPGMFRCPGVWEVTFYLHPHLKTGPGRSGLSRGIKALHGVLNRFSVNNRSNMFVYRENKENVFYLRLHEQTSNGKPLQNKLSESDERLMVSRSSSVASLSQARGTSLRVDHARTVDTRPRVRSFGEKDSDYLNKSDDSIVLVVHGISEPGVEIRKDLVQVLQNRLDDAVLEVLSVMLARNPMCKLTPADVHFIQKPYRSPESYVQLSVQPHCLPHMDALAFYLRQNILQFLYIPKYTDPRAHYHLQDYSQPEGSSLRVAENDIFLYNQSHSSGSRGIACIALAIADSSADDHVKEKRDFPKFLRMRDFVEIVSTSVYEGENRASSVPGAPIEFRIWKQGRVNLETLIEKLRAAIKHATWDLITEYNLLPTVLTAPIGNKDDENIEKFESEKKNSDPTISTASNSDLSGYELGEEGILHEIYHTTLAHWFQFALDMGVSSVKKHVVNLQHRHAIPTTIKELQNLVRVNAPDTSTKAFVLRSRQPFVVEEVLPAEGWLTFNSGVSSKEEEGRRATVVTTDGTVQPLVYVPCDTSKETRETYIKAIVVGRNFQQWKSTFRKTMETELLVPKDQKLLQKFNPLIQESRFIPRQRLLLAKVQNDNFVLYMYNWSKERSEKLIKQATNLGTWLSSRSTLFTNIIMQKLGIFHHQPTPQAYHRDENGSQYCQITDIESLAKFPYAASIDGKEWSRTANNNRNHNVGKVAAANQHSWDRVAYQALRDAKPNPHYPPNIVDPVVKAAYDLQDVHHREKKTKEELTRLYAIWQNRSSAPNIPISSVNLTAFKQHSRLIHYCHTPLLFLPQWRLQSAATRDYSLTPVSSVFPSTQQQSSQQNPWKTAAGSSTSDNVLTAWHQELCVSMLSEYKQYLQVLGFNPVQIDAGRQTEGEQNHSQNCYLKKSMLGGVLLFEIHLAEPFFIAKLRIIECSRLQTKTSSALVNQFMLSFVDACDKIKVNMHLHSFTYDFHLRCIHSYIAGTGQWSLQHGYHLTRFLDDFVKYYSKAPNYARNLVHSDIVTVSNLTTPAHTLYSYLLSHEKTYGMEVFGMTNESLDSRESEYVLVRLQSTSLVSYCDAQDTKHTDDFAVALIVSRVEQSPLIEKSEITLKYYLMLTSKRELYPKREVENNKLGKFRTVYNVARSESGSQGDVYESNSTASTSYALGKSSRAEGNGNLSELSEGSQESTDSVRFDNSWMDDEKEATTSLAPTPPPVPSSLIQNTGPSLTPEVTSSPHPVQIRQESINYLGYYSSHEQLMQQLIITQARTAREHITNMIERGTLHCRTHLLWNKLLENKSTMSYVEFMELRSLARVESLSALDSRLNPLVNQPIAWYQGLAKVLQNKYQDHHKQFNTPDGNVTHHLILHPSYLQAFMMLTIDLHTSRGELYAVYRKSAETAITPFSVNEVYSLVEGFVNACCFHLWIGLYSQ